MTGFVVQGHIYGFCWVSSSHLLQDWHTGIIFSWHLNRLGRQCLSALLAVEVFGNPVMIAVKAVVWSPLVLHSSHNWVLNPFIAAAHLYSVRVKDNSFTEVICGDTVIGCLVTEHSHTTHSLGSVQTFLHPTNTETIKKDSLLFISSPALVNLLSSSLIWLHCTVFIKSKLISYPPCLFYEYSSKIFAIFFLLFHFFFLMSLEEWCMQITRLYLMWSYFVMYAWQG